MRGHTGDELRSAPGSGRAASAWAAPSTSSCILSEPRALGLDVLCGDAAAPLPAVSRSLAGRGRRLRRGSPLRPARPGARIRSTGSRRALLAELRGRSAGADGRPWRTCARPRLGDRASSCSSERSPPSGAARRDRPARPDPRARGGCTASAGRLTRSRRWPSRRASIPQRAGRALPRPHNWVQLAKFCCRSGRAAT